MKKEREVIVETTNVKKYFPVAHNQIVKAVDGVSLKLYKGETYGLVGETGCGKSTFGRTLIRLQNPTEGRITSYNVCYTKLLRVNVRKAIRSLVNAEDMMVAHSGTEMYALSSSYMNEGQAFWVSNVGDKYYNLNDPKLAKEYFDKA